MDYNYLANTLAELASRPTVEYSTTRPTRDESGPSRGTASTRGGRLRGPSGRFTSRASTSHDPDVADHEPHQSGPKPKLNTLGDLETLMESGRHIVLREGVTIHPTNPQITSAILFEVTKVEPGLHGATEVRYLPLHNAGDIAVPRLRVASATSSQAQALPTQTLPAQLLPAQAGLGQVGPVQAGPGQAGPGQAIAARLLQTQLVPPHLRQSQRLRLLYNDRQSAQSAAQTQPPVAPIPKDRPLDILPETKRDIDCARAWRSLHGGPAAEPEASSAGKLDNLPSPSGNITEKVSSGRWPSGRVPVELFEMITQTLSHRDVRNMRLVCKEFESKASPTLFREVVVPFTAELYDMIEDDASARLSGTSVLDRRGTSAGMPPSYRAGDDGIYYQKSSDTVPRHGLRVFQGFGPHMTKFGIRFEVTEADLSATPSKTIGTKHIEAYHGGYEWPPQGYARFGRLASLEKIADETPRMTAALATLVNVREIGLSLDSGLGYLCGPDRSHYDMIFDRPAAIFEEDDPSKQQTLDGAEKLWSSLRQSHSSFSTGARLTQERLVSCILTSDHNSSVELPTVSAPDYDDTTLWPSVKAHGILGGANITKPVRGVFYTTSEELGTIAYSSRHDPPPLSPACLTHQQRQWLLETEWAQSAFLDTYTLALGDNPQVFHQITKVTISKISSGLLCKLDHDAFWNALPNVKDVTLLVSPDWRTVGKDGAGCAVTLTLVPSLAVTTFHAVTRRVADLDYLKRLRIGYTEGGENAKGMYGRNAHLMPAPVALLDQLLSPDPEVLSFDHVEDFTLVNCWITPLALMHLTTTETITAVTGRMLTFDSVSLTANTRPEFQDAVHIDIGTVHVFREGCWPALINQLGPVVEPIYHEPEPNYFATSAPAEPKFDPAPCQKITFVSCGYAALPQLATTFDQSAIELGPTMLPAQYDPDLATQGSQWFRHRAEKLREHNMSTNDDYMGRIVPWIGSRESVIFRAWGMQLGLPLGEGEDAEYDGFPKRGTGRFWGDLQTKETLFSPVGSEFGR